VFVVLESPNTCEESCAGGFWVRQLNREAFPRYVSKLDFSKLSRAAIAQAAGAGVGELLFRGTFERFEERVGADAFVVLGAWRGMPDVNPAPLDPYVTVETIDERLVAHLLNLWWERPIETVSVTGFAPPLVDTSWLSARVLSGGAIVAGRFDEASLDAAQVFVRLPDVVGPCPLFQYYCGERVATYTLAPDRCLIATGCAVPRDCPEYLPGCYPGYERLSWPSQPDACPAYACQPAFLSQ